MTVPNVVVIPTRDHRVDLLPRLTTELLIQNEFDLCLVYDNSDEQDAGDYMMLDRKLHVVDARGMGIYQMWDEGWQAAAFAYDNFNLAILNDDITVPDIFLSSLAHALRSEDDVWATYPDYGVAARISAPTGVWRATTGTYRQGGMSGWAFMLRGEIREQFGSIDREFEWWYGDDDIARRITDANKKILCVEGLGLDHESEATAHLHEWTHDAKQRDAARFKAKYS